MHVQLPAHLPTSAQHTTTITGSTSRRLLQTQSIPLTLIIPSPSPLPDPGLPPGVFSPDVDQRGIQSLPDGSIVQTIRLRNNTIVTRTIPPPPPRLPPGVVPSTVANRTFVRDGEGGWSQNVTLVNGTVVEEVVEVVTSIPVPSGLAASDIQSRTYQV